MGIAVSELLVLRDRILRRVTNSPALLYCPERCHMFALQGSELFLPFAKAFAPETRGGDWGGSEEMLGRWVAPRQGLALDMVQKIDVQAIQTLPDTFTG